MLHGRISRYAQSVSFTGRSRPQVVGTPVVVGSPPSRPSVRSVEGDTMHDIKARWLAFYAEHLEQACTQIFGYVERMIVATLIISAGAHCSSNEPGNLLVGYLRHRLVGRGVRLFVLAPLTPDFGG